MSKDFVHLHVHSDFSLLDGAVTVKKLVKAAKDCNMHSLALTDHGNMNGFAYQVIHAKKMKKQGKNFTFGVFLVFFSFLEPF